MSPQTYVFLVGGLFFVCSVATLLLACAAVMKPRRAARIAPTKPSPVKAMGGNCHVPARDRWAS